MEGTHKGYRDIALFCFSVNMCLLDNYSLSVNIYIYRLSCIYAIFHNEMLKKLNENSTYMFEMREVTCLGLTFLFLQTGIVALFV